MPRPPAPPKPKFTWRAGARVLVWLFVVAGAAWGAKRVDGFLLHDSRFELVCPAGSTSCANLAIHGAVYTDRTRIRSVFAPDFGASIFQVPLAERRRRLLAIDWVNSASLTRVWPGRIDVYVTERTPAAFAKLPIGSGSRYRLSLIDADGVLLSIPSRVRFRLPVLSGISEEQSEADRSVRVKAMQHLLDDLGPQAKDISEINAADMTNMQLIVEVDGHAVELWVGDQHYRSRYVHFINYYEEIRRHSERATVFDLRMDDRILAR